MTGEGGSRPPIGVLVMAYGTPASYEEVESFYTDVRRGRPPSAEQLADLQSRYAAVGGVSQLSVRTAEQVAGIQAALERLEPGRYSCRYGTKHASPTIEGSIEEMAGDGIEDLVALVLAPHYSAGSVGEYLRRVREKAAALGLRAAPIEDWHDDPTLVQLLAERVRKAFAAVGAEPGDDETELLVTAHSLPLRIVESGDGYDRRLEETGAPGGGGGRRRAVAGLLAERRSHTGALDRTRRARGAPGTPGREHDRCRRLPGRLCLGSPGGQLRPRHRSKGHRRRARPALCPDRVAQRRRAPVRSPRRPRARCRSALPA